MHTVINSSLEHKARAEVLATKLGLPFLTNDDVDGILFLGDRLEFQLKNTGNIYVDFLKGKSAWRRNFGGGKNQTLAKAVGVKSNYKPSIIDATAGLGQDAFVFASLGCQVTLIERSPIVGALLEDGLKRAKKDGNVIDIVSRMHLYFGDANKLIPTLDTHEVIYLDPMYPSTNKSSLPKKEMQVLRALMDIKNDEADALHTARKYAKKRVVVKRPKGAPYVGNIKPETNIISKNTRFDIYLTQT